MQLYTVEIDNLQTVSRFDNRGKKISESQITLTQTIRDLPESTARMYLKTSAAGKCRLTKQDAISTDNKRRSEIRFSDTKSRRASRAEPTRLAAKPVATPKSNKLHEAATSGDMSAAINAGE